MDSIYYSRYRTIYPGIHLITLSAFVTCLSVGMVKYDVRYGHLFVYRYGQLYTMSVMVTCLSIGMVNHNVQYGHLFSIGMVNQDVR